MNTIQRDSDFSLPDEVTLRKILETDPDPERKWAFYEAIQVVDWYLSDKKYIEDTMMFDEAVRYVANLKAIKSDLIDLFKGEEDESEEELID